MSGAGGTARTCAPRAPRASPRRRRGGREPRRRARPTPRGALRSSTRPSPTRSGASTRPAATTGSARAPGRSPATRREVHARPLRPPAPGARLPHAHLGSRRRRRVNTQRVRLTPRTGGAGRSAVKLSARHSRQRTCTSTHSEEHGIGVSVARSRARSSRHTFELERHDQVRRKRFQPAVDHNEAAQSLIVATYCPTAHPSMLPRDVP